jgi:hypothetical protein
LSHPKRPMPTAPVLVPAAPPRPASQEPSPNAPTTRAAACGSSAWPVVSIWREQPGGSVLSATASPPFRARQSMQCTPSGSPRHGHADPRGPICGCPRRTRREHGHRGKDASTGIGTSEAQQSILTPRQQELRHADCRHAPARHAAQAAALRPPLVHIGAQARRLPARTSSSRCTRRRSPPASRPHCPPETKEKKCHFGGKFFIFF